MVGKMELLGAAVGPTLQSPCELRQKRKDGFRCWMERNGAARFIIQSDI